MHDTGTAPTVSLPSPLVSSDWLAGRLALPTRDEHLVVLDASVVLIADLDGSPEWLSGEDQFLVEGHIPGALYADLLDQFSDASTPLEFTRPQREQFELAASALGISTASTVIIYDCSIGHWAARLWWLFRAFGHERVAVLDGGLTNWRRELRPLELGYRQPEPATFVASPRDDLWVDKAGVAAIVNGEADAALVCAAPAREFSGDVAHHGRAGHIPGSVGVPASHLVDRVTRLSIGEAALREKFAAVLSSDRPVVSYCGIGVSAAADALALTLLGVDAVAVYDGSLDEWAADVTAPLTTLPVSGTR